MGVVLVGFDGSPSSRRALDHAVAQAKENSSELVLLTAVPSTVENASIARMMPAGVTLPPELSNTFSETALQRLQMLATDLEKMGLKVRPEVRAGNVVDVLVAVAEEVRASEIIIGHKAYEGKHVETGPNAAEMVTRAKVRVTLVP